MMKKKYTFPSILLFTMVVIFPLLQGCGASHITFSVLTPSPVTIPDDVHTIAVLDRSAGTNEDLSRLESFLTGEGKDRDRIPAQFVLDGLTSSLENNTDYHIVRIPEIMKGSATGNLFPPLLSWSKVAEVCDKYHADALIVLENYDSDFLLSPDIKGTLSGNKPEVAGMATVHCGFRFYDPGSRLLLDEFNFKHDHVWNPRMGAVISSVIMLNEKPKVIREASTMAGRVYAQRITPSWYRVTRDYFKHESGNPDLGVGARMMEANNWDQAIASLQRAVSQGNRKSRGRAAHDMAVVYEILGDLKQAKEWASVAWGQYKIRKSKDYGYLLTNRINEQAVLDEQMY